jgi:hypothetical protein
MDRININSLSANEPQLLSLGGYTYDANGNKPDQTRRQCCAPWWAILRPALPALLRHPRTGRHQSLFLYRQQCYRPSRNPICQTRPRESDSGTAPPRSVLQAARPTACQRRCGKGHSERHCPGLERHEQTARRTRGLDGEYDPVDLQQIQRSLTNMLRRSWRFWLPVAQVLLAIGLAMAGRAQTRHENGEKFQTWDYIAPAEIVLHSINYPAAVATGFTVRHRKFQIGLEYSTATFLTYLAYIGFLWLPVGWFIDKWLAGSAIARAVPAWLSLIGILFGGLLMVTAFGMLRGPYGLLLVGAGFLWSAVFLATFAVMFTSKTRSHT